VDLCAFTQREVNLDSCLKKYLRLSDFLARRIDTVNFKQELGKLALIFRL